MRKKLIIILVVVGVVIISGIFLRNVFQEGCTLEARICQDGSSVGRNVNLACEFDSCPELEFCDINGLCSEGMQCYKFPDEEEPYCYVEYGYPCFNCASGECDIAESHPLIVQCK